jgi:hypothetical protein
LFGRDVTYSTRSGGEQSRIFARRVCCETGLRAKQVLVRPDSEGCGDGK